MEGEVDGKSHKNNNKNGNEKNPYPPGYRFDPCDYELLVNYLSKKVMNQPLPPVDIHEFDVYKYHPRTLSDTFRVPNEKFTYFFTPRTRRSPKGVRPSRRAGDNGFWKATAADTSVGNKDRPAGYKASLVFYEAKSTKTNWIMHEYRLHKSTRADERKFDDWVLCRIYENVKGKRPKGINPVDDDKPESSGTALCNGSHPPFIESANLIRPFNNIGPNTGCHFGCCIQKGSVPSCSTHSSTSQCLPGTEYPLIPENQTFPGNEIAFTMEEFHAYSMSTTQFDDIDDLLHDESARSLADSFLNTTGCDHQQHDVPKPVT